MDFSLFYFDGDGSKPQADSYQLLIEGAKFADQNGFTAVWTPERHFHAFGGLYPNPALIGAAIAVLTNTVELRAGSVVAPLHHPARIAEDWAVVDRLSRGRAAFAFASGWTVDDFILSSAPYENRKQQMWQAIDQVKRLWEGDIVELPDANGKCFQITTFPRPLQRQFPLWITCQSPTTFLEAGKRGANVLTSLLGGTLDDIAPLIRDYRQARENHGHDPDQGKVALMLHTFLGDDPETIREQVQEPFSHYLKTHVNLLGNLVKSLGIPMNLENFSEQDVDSLLWFAVEGFLNGRSLIGTPETCQPMIDQVKQAGVDEIACLIDFIPDFNWVINSLPRLKTLKEKYHAPALSIP